MNDQFISLKKGQTDRQTDMAISTRLLMYLVFWSLILQTNNTHMLKGCGHIFAPDGCGHIFAPEFIKHLMKLLQLIFITNVY